jgi:hypothetical protein
VGGGKEGVGGRGGEMIQTLYAHMNKIKIRIKENLKKRKLKKKDRCEAHSHNLTYVESCR